MFVKLHTDALFVTSRILHNEFNIREWLVKARAVTSVQSLRSATSHDYDLRDVGTIREIYYSRSVEFFFFHNLTKRGGKATESDGCSEPDLLQFNDESTGVKIHLAGRAGRSFSTYRENFSRCRLVAGCYKVLPISDEIPEIRQILSDGQLEKFVRNARPANSARRQ